MSVYLTNWLVLHFLFYVTVFFHMFNYMLTDISKVKQIKNTYSREHRSFNTKFKENNMDMRILANRANTYKDPTNNSSLVFALVGRYIAHEGGQIWSVCAFCHKKTFLSSSPNLEGEASASPTKDKVILHFDDINVHNSDCSRPVRHSWRTQCKLSDDKTVEVIKLYDRMVREDTFKKQGFKNERLVSELSKDGYYFNVPTQSINHFPSEFSYSAKVLKEAATDEAVTLEVNKIKKEYDEYALVLKTAATKTSLPPISAHTEQQRPTTVSASSEGQSDKEIIDALQNVHSITEIKKVIDKLSCCKKLVNITTVGNVLLNPTTTGDQPLIRTATLEYRKKYISGFANDYSDAEKREKSFTGKWPIEKDPKPSELAKAGFTCLSKDAVECFCCGCKLDNWNPDDDPLIRHYEANSECPYVVENNVNEFIQIKIWERDTKLGEKRIEHLKNPGASAVAAAKANAVSYSYAETNVEIKAEKALIVAVKTSIPEASDDEIRLTINLLRSMNKIVNSESVGSVILIPDDISDLASVSPAVHKHMELRGVRLLTFKSSVWPPKYRALDQYGQQTIIKKDVPTAEDMVDAAFFFTGTDLKKDNVTCYYCGKSIESFEPGDVPLIEHAAYFPDCAYIQENTTEEFRTKAKRIVKQREALANTANQLQTLGPIN